MQLDPLPNRGLPRVDLIDVALSHHPVQIGDLDHPLHPPTAVADLFLVAAPASGVDDRAAARGQNGHPLDAVLRFGDDRGGASLLALQERDLGIGCALEVAQTGADLGCLLFGQRVIELDLLPFLVAGQIGRRLELHGRLAHPAVGLGQIHFLVFPPQAEIGAPLLDLLARLFRLRALLFQPALQLARVESQNRTAGRHFTPFGCHH